MSRGARIPDPGGPLANIIAEPEKYSLKRAAWAYGCAAKGSEEEAALLEILIRKIREREVQQVIDTIKITPDPGIPGRVDVTFQVPQQWTNTYLSQPVPLGKPIIARNCHPGDKCDNYPSCESCGPARL